MNQAMRKNIIAVVGNPNCGKTTLFNGLTGSHQTVGNWPGVTVERIVGEFTYKDREITIVDLPVFTPCSRVQLPVRTNALPATISSRMKPN